jgi:ADP-heptose:LPS heptosyltransferase
MRFKALGDIVLSLPIVYALRRRYPHAWIRYLCRKQYAEALSGVKEIDEVMELPGHPARQASLALRLKREHVDCVIDLLGSPRSALLTVLTGASTRIGMDTGRRNWCYTHLVPRAVFRGGRRVKCYTLESNREIVASLGLPLEDSAGTAIGFPAADLQKGWAQNYLSCIGARGKRIIGLVPGSAYQAKSWPERKFVELARLAQERLGAIVLIFWGPGEESLARRIAAEAPGSIVAPSMGASRLGALVSLVDVLAGIDSGPKHIAVLQGVPTVTLFGPTDPCIWDPMSDNHRAMKLDVDCFPCKKKTCRENRCISGIEPGMVLKEIVEVLALGDGEDPGTRKIGDA